MKNKAFTMAEILISLTIIGIIAALTLPALLANINEKVWNTQRKALHSRLAQALAAMPRLDGYSGANAFLQDGLANSFNITKICTYDNKSRCDFVTPQFLMDDSAFVGELGAQAVFNTVNGESVAIDYHSDCRGSGVEDVQASNPMCAMFVYDLNGSKGPNKVGKDVGFIAAFFPEFPTVVAPMPVAISNGDTLSSEDLDQMLEDNKDYRLPSLPEITALFDVRGLLFEGGDASMQENAYWADNDVSCQLQVIEQEDDDDIITYSCETNASGSANVIFLSKNGDAPRTFKDLTDNE